MIACKCWKLNTNIWSLAIIRKKEKKVEGFARPRVVWIELCKRDCTLQIALNQHCLLSPINIPTFHFFFFLSPHWSLNFFGIWKTKKNISDDDPYSNLKRVNPLRVWRPDKSIICEDSKTQTLAQLQKI